MSNSTKCKIFSNRSFVLNVSIMYGILLIVNLIVISPLNFHTLIILTSSIVFLFDNFRFDCTCMISLYACMYFI